jgi:hypothetical protein
VYQVVIHGSEYFVRERSVWAGPNNTRPLAQLAADWLNLRLSA